MRNVESKVARTRSRINALNDCAPSRLSDVSRIFLRLSTRNYIFRAKSSVYRSLKDTPCNVYYHVPRSVESKVVRSTHVAYAYIKSI